jgi:Fe-S cluster assembly protein SufD
MTQLATAQDRTVHVDLYARLAEQSRIERAPWLDELRRAAMARFEQVGFPSKKDEEWRFTDLSPITKTQFKLAERVPDELATDVAASFSFGTDAVSELVFVNGHFAPGLSRIGKLPRGVKVGRLADAINDSGELVEPHLAKLADVERNPFVALNTGFLSDGAFLHFARGTVVEQPIHLLFVSAKGADLSVSHPRVLVIAEENVQATIVESYVGGGAGIYFTNAVTEIVAGQGSQIDHCKLQQESLDANHVATMQVKLGRDATFVSHSATIGAKLTRNDLNCHMAGQGAYATLNGLVLVGGNQHCDNHTLLDHAEPNCPSHELYKHVLSGKSTAVFKGKILVRQPAQKTDSKQTSKTLLLSDDATMNSQPALEIYADDVKCTHGSTIGPVDEDMIFYLRSRGVGLEAARHLLSYAFAADITRRIKVEPVRRRLEDFMAAQHGLPQDLRITNLGAFDEAVQT